MIGAILIFLVSSGTKLFFYIEENTKSVADKGGEYIEGIVGQPVFINPIIPTTESDRDISRLVFSSLTDIADSIKMSENGEIWNIRLKENILWQDDERLTSDDIIYTVNVIQDPESHSPLYPSFQGVAVERISELEVKFTLQSPYAFFEKDHLKNLGIIPKHIFSDTSTPNLKLSAYGLKPIGSGMYKVKDYKIDDKGVVTTLTMEENKNFSGNKPNIEKIIINFYKNTDELMQAYNFGQIDGFGTNSSKDADKITIRNREYYLGSQRYYAIFINQNLGPKEFKNIKVRETLNLSADRQRIINEVFDSHATPFYGPTALTVKPEKTYDAALIKNLELNLIVPDEQFLVETANIIKENWESAGAKVNLKILPMKIIQEDVLKNNDYEMILFGNIVKESHDLFSFWHSSRKFDPGQNLALYQNKKLDGELEAYRKDFDETDRAKKIKEISDMIANDVPAIFLYSPEYLYIAAPRLEGFNTDKTINTATDRFSDINNWFVKTKRVFK